MARLDVVIPAGGAISADFERVVGTKSKALIKFDGSSILKITIDALRGSPLIGRIVVVGSEDVIASEDAKLADVVLPAVGSSPTNINVGVHELSTMNFPPDRVLIVTADLPFLTTPIIEEFIGLCSEQSDFSLPLVAKTSFDERFPGATAMFVRLHDGDWTAGCMYIASVRGLKVATPHLEKLFANRKSKIKMASILGFKFIWDYLQRKLTVSSIEEKVKELLNVRGAAIPGSPPEIAYDIDDADDYHFAVAQFKVTRLKVEQAEP